MLELLVGMPFHAFFGIAVMMSARPIVGFFSRPPGSWDLDPVSDQIVGGGIAWAFGEVPTLLVLATRFARWFRADRRAERDSDAELTQ